MTASPSSPFFKHLRPAASPYAATPIFETPIVEHSAPWVAFDAVLNLLLVADNKPCPTNPLDRPVPTAPLYMTLNRLSNPRECTWLQSRRHPLRPKAPLALTRHDPMPRHAPGMKMPGPRWSRNETRNSNISNISHAPYRTRRVASERAVVLSYTASVWCMSVFDGLCQM